VATSGSDEPAIQTRGLTRRYGLVLALDHLDLEVPARSIFDLLGPNGAGKTTALRILAGLTRPTSGSALVAGIEVGSGGLELQRRIGVLDQEPRYYSWMTGRELVTLAGRLHGLDGSPLRRRVDELLELVGLTGAARRRIGGYSGGMRQRIGIAQALVGRPPVLILDEPVSSLDPEGRRDLLTLIGTLREAATVLFSTHVLNDVERVCDRVGILNGGRLVAEAPLEQLLERYAQPSFRLEAEPGQAVEVDALAARLRALPWISEVRSDGDRLTVAVRELDGAGRQILALVAEADLDLIVFERQRPDLEDVFLRIVAGDRSGGRGSGGRGSGGRGT
jgi:ABC-2 type transport system ATP-binding protein